MKNEKTVSKPQAKRGTGQRKGRAIADPLGDFSEQTGAHFG